MKPRHETLRQWGVFGLLLAFGYLSLATSDIDPCRTEYKTREAKRKFDVVEGESSLPVLVQFTGDFAILSVTAPGRVLDAEGMELPEGPNGSGGGAQVGGAGGTSLGLAGSPASGGRSGGGPMVEGDDGAPAGCEAIVAQYFDLEDRNTMVCLKGSQEHQLLFVPDASTANALMVTATVYVGVSSCAANDNIIMGVRIEDAR